MKRAAALTTALLGVTWAVASCGGAAGLADPGACPTPAASLTDDSSDRAYRMAAIGGIELIQGLDQRFRQAWDERRLRERGEFRRDFAVYAHETMCQLEVMQALQPPAGGEYTAMGVRLRGVVGEYLVAMEAGQDAVAKRNASAYDDWVKRVDVLAVALGELREELLAGN